MGTLDKDSANVVQLVETLYNARKIKLSMIEFIAAKFLSHTSFTLFAKNNSHIVHPLT